MSKKLDYDRTKNTFTCECMSYLVRGYCRHIRLFRETLIEKRLMVINVDYNQVNKIFRKYNIDISQRKNVNKFIFFNAESDKHRRAKFAKCEELLKLKHDFICEALSSKNGRRYDLIDLTDDIIYEFETTNIIKKGAKTIQVN